MNVKGQQELPLDVLAQHFLRVNQVSSESEADDHGENCNQVKAEACRFKRP